VRANGGDFSHPSQRRAIPAAHNRAEIPERPEIPEALPAVHKKYPFGGITAVDCPPTAAHRRIGPFKKAPPGPGARTEAVQSGAGVAQSASKPPLRPLIDTAQLPILRPMRRLLIGLATAAVLLAAGFSGVTSSAATSSGTNSAVSARMAGLPLLQNQVLASINELRRKQGLVPLKANPALAAAAFEQSASMAEHGFFAHESYGGSPFWKRVAAKYAGRSGSWSVGENLVFRSPQLNAQTALELWLQSPEHKSNMLSPTWREIGLGAVHVSSAPGVYEGRAVTILTADFGVRH